MPALRGPDGKVIFVGEDEVQRYTTGGEYTRVGSAEAGGAQSQIAAPEIGVRGKVRGILSSLLSGATLGGSDVLLSGSDEQAEQLRAEREASPVLAPAAQAAGMIIPAIVTGGAATPSGYLSSVAARAGAEGGVKALAATAAEGAIQNAGIYLSDVALGDRELSAEGVTGALGTGLAFGAAGHVAAQGIEAGTIAARRMFARYAEGGEKAARQAAQQWNETSAKTLEGYDQAAEIARAKLSAATSAREQAALAQQQASAGVAEARAGIGRPQPLPAEPPMPPQVEIAKLLSDRGVASTNPERLVAWDAENGPRLLDLMNQNGPKIYSSGTQFSGGFSPAGDAAGVEARAAGTAPPPNAIPPEQAARIFGGEGVEFAPGVRSAADMTGQVVPPKNLSNALGDLGAEIRAASPADAELSGALSEYTSARKAFDEMRARVDPDLEAALHGLGEVETPWERNVPVGEFGAPGKGGFKTQGELGRLAAGTDAPGAVQAGERAAPDVTSNLRAGARGTPVGEAPAATDSLTGQLRATAAGLSEGKSLGELAAESPARAEYVAAKQTKTTEAAEHFRAEAVAKRDVPEYAAIKAHEVKADDYLEQTLSARKIGDRGYYEPPGAGEDAVRAGNARQAISEGQREAIKLNVSAEGKITVTDGRHRLAAAIESDAPIKVKWSTGAEPAADDVLRGGRAAARSDSTTAFKLEDSGLKFNPLKRSYFDETGDAFAKTPVSDMKIGLPPRAEPMDPHTTVRGHPLAAKQLEMAHDAALDRVAAATSAEERSAAQAEVKAIEKQITKVGARPGAVEDVAAMAHVTTRVEAAAAKLTEAMGADAPAAAKEAAKNFRAAEDAASRKTVARIARSADDWSKEQAALPTEPTGAQRVATAKQAKLEADAKLAAARASEAEAKLGAKAAGDQADALRTKRPGEAGAELVGRGPGVGKKVLEGARAVGVAAELAGDFGIPGVPKPHDIPVIGPILSAYLKYRAFRAAAGRFVGRVPATAETRAAALAAKTKDSIAKAVDRSLGLISRNTPIVRKAIVASSLVVHDALSRRAIDDGQPDAPKGASTPELAAVRMREVAAAATNPQLVIDKVRKEMKHVLDPDLIDAMENHLVAMYKHLNDTAPKGPPPNPYTKQQWTPSAADALQWGRRLAVANNPLVAFEALHAQALTIEAADTMRVCYSKLFAFAQQRLIERAAELKHPVEYRQLVQNGLLFNLPLHASLDPENAAVLQSAHVPIAPTPPQSGAGGPPAPSIANPTNLSQVYQTTADRRAAR